MEDGGGRDGMERFLWGLSVLPRPRYGTGMFELWVSVLISRATCRHSHAPVSPSTRSSERWWW